MIVVLAGSAVAGALAAWVARNERRSAERHADELVARLALHPARGLTAGSGRILTGEPLVGLAPAPGPLPAVEATITQVGAGPECGGTLTRHRDRSLSCHGGRGDCWGTQYRHARPAVECRTLAYGCGTCDNTPVAVEAPAPACMPVEDTSCARCGKRPGVVLVAASGSFPTSVCQQCADAIAEGRVLRMGGAS